MAVTATPTVAATPAPVAKTVTPTPTPVAVVSTPAPVPAPTLSSQLGQVDPIIWAALVGVLVIPFLQQGLKKVVGLLGADLGRRVNVLLLAILSGASALLINTVSSGVLDNLHNPLLTLILTGLIAFATGTGMYQVVLKKDTPDPATAADLPVVDPA